jgi:CPA2 family monovalent cation:H+ antiporter-2
MGLMPAEGQSLVLAAALISIAANSAVFASVEPVQKWVRERSELARRLEQRDDPLAQLPMSIEQSLLTKQVVIVGYGRVGRRIGTGLREQKIPFVVAEQNREIVEALRKDGIPAVSGDAAEPAVLIQAHIARAAMLVIAIPDTLNIRKMVEIAKTLNPSVAVVLRTHNEDEAALWQNECLGDVFFGEHELARNMASHVVAKLRGA